MRPATVVTVLACALSLSVAFAATTPMLDIPYKKFTLDNGLTLIVHEDHKAPIVAVNVWYHVGAKNEKDGKTGFAHLFEHLMFNGSEHFNTDYFKAVEKIGATDLNGTTNEDRTNYFQNVPTPALDLVLWLESDRMGHLAGAIDQAKLDEQRGVVQNEKRQGENEPYAISDELITKAVWPAAHPYAHTVIGSMDDLNAASLADVKEWFRTYYGPSNAVVVVAGDVTPATALEKVKKFFGDIPPGPPVAHFESWTAKRTASQREVAQDHVPQPRIYKVWNVPRTGTADNAYLDMLSDVLVGDKASRLYKRLMYDDQTATEVSAYIDAREIGSLFVIEGTAKPDADLAKFEKAIDEEVTKVLRDGITPEELDRVRTQQIARFIRGAERIGGFGGKSDILARSQVFNGSPDAYKKTLNWIASATPEQVQRAGKEWLNDGVYTLTITPFPKFAAAAQGADRSKLPEPGEPAAPKFTEMHRARLSNGMNLIVAERHAVPVVNFSLMLDAGYAADQEAIPGTASLALKMLDEGTSQKNAIQMSTEFSRLGATVSTGSTLDASYVNLSALKPQLDPALKLYSEMILDPAFREADFQRLQKLQLATIQQEKASPFAMALRVMPRLIYGQGHAYANPFTGSGTEESVSKISRGDLVKFHETWFKPNAATMIVVGDTTLGEIQPKLEAMFASWKPGDVPKKNIATVAAAQKPVVYMIDKPGALQSLIIAGVVAPPKSAPEDLAMTTMNTVLGGAFVSRINMNLREDKHWSYGAGSFIPSARGQRIFIAYAPVQTDKTKESVVEVSRELKDVTKDRVITADEMADAKTRMALSLPGRWETSNQVAGAIRDLVQFALPEDYYDTYAGKVKAMTLTDTNAAAVEVVKPQNLTWVIVGDRSRIEQGVRDLNLGEMRFVDADGNPVK